MVGVSFQKKPRASHTQYLGLLPAPLISPQVSCPPPASPSYVNQTFGPLALLVLSVLLSLLISWLLTGSLLTFGSLGLLVRGSFLGLLVLSPISSFPLPISPLLSPLMVRFSMDPYQMPLAVLFLISTIKHFSSTISRDGHVLIFIQWVTCLSHK